MHAQTSLRHQRHVQIIHGATSNIQLSTLARGQAVVKYLRGPTVCADIFVATRKYYVSRCFFALTSTSSALTRLLLNNGSELPPLRLSTSVGFTATACVKNMDAGT